MSEETLKHAMSEAERFLRAARLARDSKKPYSFVGSKETGAVKRASLDLTRALAEMRRP